MAQLVIRHSPVVYIGVDFDDDDLHRVLVAIKEQHTHVTVIADMLGVARTYFYSGFRNNSLELSKVLELQRLLGCDLISHHQLTRAVDRLKHHLSQLFNQEPH